ncbi:(2Fe-2S)-binding protein [Phytoactinopolyspora alkaliphila]|uniref:(2Fe-2S)-binding protein n=1 Tax=Phytoactinopolyspora alkaliphila TaxID=1783498 RepID=A0A6N9YJ90_9ACTN|nr:(2Fe-2S)-binding protein [Phytoactinopolyspora alkaliphila]
MEAATALDTWQRPVHAAAQALLGDQGRADVLRGRWLGHAVHPLLTDIPVGAWTSSMMLDAVGGRTSRTASRRLIALGIVAAVPTAVTGLAEWAHTTAGERRVGFVHALGNTAALGLYTASWAARHRGRYGRGVVLGLAGAAAASAAGYLGGHLTSARKVSSRHPAFERPSPR